MLSRLKDCLTPVVKVSVWTYLSVVGQCEVSAHQTVAVVSKQDDPRLLGQRVECLEV